MIKVDVIDANGANVSLVEHDNIEGQINESDCVLNRIEAAVVQTVSPTPVLSRTELSFDDKHLCEQRYIKGMYVQSILRSVARDLYSDLSAIHKAKHCIRMSC
ncbi:unnamed protein product [Arabidopsis halleri]